MELESISQTAKVLMESASVVVHLFLSTSEAAGYASSSANRAGDSILGLRCSNWSVFFFWFPSAFLFLFILFRSSDCEMLHKTVFETFALHSTSSSSCHITNLKTHLCAYSNTRFKVISIHTQSLSYRPHVWRACQQTPRNWHCHHHQCQPVVSLLSQLKKKNTTKEPHLMHKLFSLFDGEHIPHCLHYFCQFWNIYMCELFCMDNNQSSSMLTCSLHKAISLFIKNFECLPDLIFNLWILEFPERLLVNKKGQYPYLVINQTNSLKLMSPSPSWSMTETISWNIFGTFSLT